MNMNPDDEIVEGLRVLGKYGMSSVPPSKDAADLIVRQKLSDMELEQKLAKAYMCGVKKAIYEIMKEADIPGSEEIRDSGDSDDGMCSQVAERINSKIAASNGETQVVEQLRKQLRSELENFIVKDTYTKGKNAGIRTALVFMDDILAAERGPLKAGEDRKND